MATNRFKKMSKNDVKEIVSGSIISTPEKIEVENNDVSVKKENTPKTRKSTNKKKEIETRSFGVKISTKEELKNLTMTIPKKLYDVIDSEVKVNKGKRNSLIKNVLEEIYNPKTLEFTIKIDKKEDGEMESLPIALPERLSAALEKVSERTNKSKSEVFTELLERFLDGER